MTVYSCSHFVRLYFDTVLLWAKYLFLTQTFAIEKKELKLLFHKMMKYSSIELGQTINIS